MKAARRSHCQRACVRASATPLTTWTSLAVCGAAAQVDTPQGPRHACMQAVCQITRVVNAMPLPHAGTAGQHSRRQHTGWAAAGHADGPCSQRCRCGHSCSIICPVSPHDLSCTLYGGCRARVMLPKRFLLWLARRKRCKMGLLVQDCCLWTALCTATCGRASCRWRQHCSSWKLTSVSACCTVHLSSLHLFPCFLPSQMQVPRRLLSSARATTVAFCLASFSTLVGAFVAWSLVGSRLGPDGWKLASALTASYIGGSINFAAVSASLGLAASGGPLVVATMAAGAAPPVSFACVCFGQHERAQCNMYGVLQTTLLWLHTWPSSACAQSRRCARRPVRSCRITVCKVKPPTLSQMYNIPHFMCVQ